MDILSMSPDFTSPDVASTPTLKDLLRTNHTSHSSAVNFTEDHPPVETASKDFAKANILGCPEPIKKEKLSPIKKRAGRWNRLWKIAICFQILTFILLIALGITLIGGIGICYPPYQQKCEGVNARCVIEGGYTTCECLELGKRYYEGEGGSCAFRCEAEGRHFCPYGVCIDNECHPDISKFVESIYDKRCYGSEPLDKCNISCGEIVQQICSYSSTPRFCSNRPSASYGDFVCQYGGRSGGFRLLSSKELSECNRDLACRKLITIYPCLAGYVRHGSMICNKTCQQNSASIEAISLFGYCILKQATCEAAVANLVETLDGYSIGHSVSNESFAARESQVTHLLAASLEMKRFKYALMIAYANLIKEKKVPLSPYTNMTFRQFLKPKEFSNMESHMRSLYTLDPKIISKIKNASMKYPRSDPVGKDPYTHTAHLITVTDCKDFHDCPPGKFKDWTGLLIAWLQNTRLTCALAKILYAQKFNVSSLWYRHIAAMRSANFTTEAISFIYTPKFISKRIEDVREFIALRKLNDNVFFIGSYLCEATHDSTYDPNDIVLPLTIYNGLHPPEGVSGYALVLASSNSIKKALCGETQKIPSVKCEIILYFAFAAFMPPPTEQESNLIHSNKRTLIYLILRAAMRRQLLFGAKLSSFEVRKNLTTTDVLSAATSVARKCLRTINSFDTS